mgnify:CR=1 FL=1|jgi:hypothetical protein
MISVALSKRLDNLNVHEADRLYREERVSFICNDGHVEGIFEENGVELFKLVKNNMEG